MKGGKRQWLWYRTRTGTCRLMKVLLLVALVMSLAYLALFAFQGNGDLVLRLVVLIALIAYCYSFALPWLDGHAASAESRRLAWVCLSVPRLIIIGLLAYDLLLFSPVIIVLAFGAL